MLALSVLYVEADLDDLFHGLKAAVIGYGLRGERRRKR